MTRYVWYDSAWVRGFNGKPTIVLFGRNIDNPEETVKIGVQNFKPYFYAPYNELSIHHNPKEISCFGDEIEKIEVKAVKNVKIDKEKFSRTWMADYVLDMRYVVDQGIWYGFDEFKRPIEVEESMLPRILYYDIEVRSPEGIFPRYENPIYPVVIISACDSYTGDVKVFTWGIPKVKDYQVACDSEEEMFVKWAQWVHKVDFDVVTGWNSSGFDVPYIIERTKFIELDLTKWLSRLERGYINERKWMGRQLVDQMEFFKDWSKPQGKMPYGLKYIAKTFANFVYDECGDKIDQMFNEERWDELVTYGFNDAIALKKIDDAIGLFKFYENLRMWMGVKLCDMLQRSLIIETYLLREGIKPMPTKEYHEGDKIKGATVLLPTAGIKHDIGCFDAKALYPTIIIAENISPDIDSMIPKTIVKLMDKREEMRAKRLAGDSSEILATAEQSLKYIINSFYGYMLYKRARLYSREHGAQITAGGRKLAKLLKDTADENDHLTIYGDTDSVFVDGIKTIEIGITLEATMNDALMKWTLDKGIEPHYAPTVKFEKVYKRIMFKKKIGSEIAAKKRYVGLLTWKDGKDIFKLDYTGIEVRRSDVAPITKKTMVDFFEMLLVEDNSVEAVQIVKRALMSVKRGEVSLQDVAIPKGVHSTKTNPHVRGMKHGKDLMKIMFREDKKPQLLLCKRPFKEICIDENVVEVPMIQVGFDGRHFEVLEPEDTILAQEQESKSENSIEKNVKIIPMFEIDWDAMAQKTITQKMQSLVESIGISWGVTIEGQTTLFSFAEEE